VLKPDTDLSVNRFLAPEDQVEPSDDDIIAQFSAAGLREAQGQDESDQRAIEAFMQSGYQESMRADGFWEHTAAGLGSVGKSFGDAVFNAGAFLVKSAYGAVDEFSSPLTGRSFVDGYDDAAMVLEQRTGTKDPGILDIMASMGKIIGVVDEDTIDVGARADVILRGRLGNAALFTETAGFLASFAVGGGANLGKIGAPLGKLGGPVARMMQKPAERAIAKMMAKSPAETMAILESGQAWKVLTSTTEWKKSASMMERTLALGGRNAQDLLSLTGANVVQSYAMSTDDERTRQLAVAAYTSPALLPLGKIGAAFASKIASVGMDLPSAKLLQGALKRLESGEITSKQLSKELWSSSNPAMRGLGNAVASAFEGTMFMGISPEAHDLMAAWMGGDMDSGAKLQALWLASVGGVAATKGLVPADLAPMFKRVRPEANTLDLYIEAHTNKLSANEKTLQDAATRQAQESLFQDPQNKPLTLGKAAPQAGGSAAPTTFINKSGWKIKKGLSEADVHSLAESKAKAEAEGREAWDYDGSNEAHILEQSLGLEMDALALPVRQQMDALAAENHANFGWATAPTHGLLRSGWEPSFSNDGSGDVHVALGRDHSVLLSGSHESGITSMVASSDVIQMLNDVGALPGTPEHAYGNNYRLHGEAATEAIHNLSLISVARQMEFALNAERLGMEEVVPGVYARPGEPIHHYVQLDGSVVTRTPMDNSWVPGKVDMQVVGDSSPPIWNHPSADYLAALLQSKVALSPDKLVDTAISQSIQLARHGKGGAADELRAAFESMTTEQIDVAFKPGSDDFLAFDLGSVGSGMSNAHQLMMDRYKSGMNRKSDAEMEAGAEMAAAKPELPPGEHAEAMEGKVRATPEALQNTLSNRLQGLRDAQGKEYREAMDEAARGDRESLEFKAKPDDGPPGDKPGEGPSGEVAFRRQDNQREAFVERANAVPPEASTKIRMSGRQAAVLKRFVSEKSDLGRQINDMTDLDAREVNVTSKDLKAVVKGWTKYAPTERQKKGSTKEIASDHQSADAWVKNTLDQIGAKPAQGGYDAPPKFIGISEQIHGRLKPPKSQPKGDGKRRGKPGDPEFGGLDLTGAGDSLVGLGSKILKGAGKGVGKAVDFMVRDMADALTGRGFDFGARLKKMRSRSGQIEGKALEHAKKMVELQNGKATKEEFARLVIADRQVGTSESSKRTKFMELIDGRVKPSTPLEKEIARHGEAFNASLRDAASDAGSYRSKKGDDGKPFFEPIRKGGKTVSQHVEGKDMQKVMNSDKLRRALFDDLAEQNEMWTTENGERRRVTGDDLNNEWVAKSKDEGKTVGGADKKSAVEFSRRFNEYPEVWTGPDGKDYQVQEANPWDRMHRTAQKQAGRAAAVEEFGFGGNGVDAAKLRKIGEAEGWSQHHLDALEKGGVEKNISDTYEANLRGGTELASEAKTIKSMMDLLAGREQAVEPQNRILEGTKAAQVWSQLQALRSSSLSALAFLRDVPDFFRGMQFTGVRRNFRAISELAGSTKEFTQRLERDGILMLQMGDFIYQEARGPARKVADKASWAAQKTERAKAILNAKQVELMIKDMNAGKGTDMDYYFVETLLGHDVRGKKITGDLDVQIMREGVEFLSSRARKGTYSRFADDPRTTQLLLFQRFASKRLESHIKVIQGVFSTSKQHGWGSKQAIAARKVAIRTAMGVTAMGVIGDWMIEGVVGMVTEGDFEGFKQFYNEATASPQAAFAQWTDSVKNQVVGGPAATITRMASDPDNVKTWTDTTSIGAMAHSLFTFSQEVLKGDSAAGVHLMTNSGLVPFRRVMASWTRSAVMGKDESVRRASLQVWNWRRENDLMPASGGSKARPEEFYDAVGKSIRSLANNGMDSDKALKEASANIREALALAPSESVAASIRGHRMVSNLTPQQRQKLYDSINDPARVTQILQFDEALTDMARQVSRMEGTAPSDFEETMDLVAKQAAMGSSDQWREVTTMAVDAAIVDFDLGGSGTAEIREVARHLAMYPEHVKTVFSGREMMAITRRENSMDRADLIWRLLWRRAKMKQVNDDRQDKRDQVTGN
tara:strand:- start:7128 stop:13304 length:6177 start_codon:yes stop_codon:yes gene_type:complete